VRKKTGRKGVAVLAIHANGEISGIIIESFIGGAASTSAHPVHLIAKENENDNEEMD
jgi:hypothetical protein